MAKAAAAAEKEKMNREEIREIRQLVLANARLQLDRENAAKEARRDVFQLITAGLTRGMTMGEIEKMVRFAEQICKPPKEIQLTLP
ncbi:hypothetical protein BGZ94_009776 [Podila epigama]|nr:hypothetical protein BGZ94_009776 [Podila epigama]